MQQPERDDGRTACSPQRVIRELSLIFREVPCFSVAGFADQVHSPTRLTGFLPASPFHRVLSNTTWNVVGRVWGLGIALFLTPYVLSHLGAARFGLWGLIGAMIGYARYLDLGLHVAITRSIAEAAATGDQERQLTLFTSGLMIALALGGIGLGLALIVREPVIALLSIPATLENEAKGLVLATGVGLMLAQISNWLEGVFTGLQRMAAINLAAMAASVIQVILTIIGLAAGGGLAAVALAAIAAEGVTTISLLLLLSKTWPTIHATALRRSLWTVLHNSFGICWDLIRYGLRLQMSQLSALVDLQWNRWLVGRFLTLEAVAAYTLGQRLSQMVMGFPLLTVSAITPAAASDWQRGDRAAVSRLYLASARWLAWAAAGMAGFLVVAAGPALTAWVGPGWSPAIVVVQVLSCVSLVRLLSGPGTAVARGIGQAGLETRSALLSLLFQVGLGLLLAPSGGIAGVLLAQGAATLIGVGYFLARFHRVIALAVVKTVWATLSPPLGVTLFATIAAGTWFYLHGDLWSSPGTGRVEAFLALASGGMIFGIVYGGLVGISWWRHKWPWSPGHEREV